MGVTMLPNRETPPSPPPQVPRESLPLPRAGCPVSMIHSNSIWWFRLPYNGIQTYFFMIVNPIFLWLVFPERQSKELKQYVHPMSLSIASIICKIVNKYLYNFRSWNQTTQVPRSFIGRGNSYIILLKNWRILGLNYWWISSTYNTQI